MSGPEIIKETPICLAQVKQEVERIKKRDKELSFRTQRTEEYLIQFVHQDATKLVEALKKLNISRLKEEHIVKIADLLPKTVDDLKIVLQGYTITVTKENMKQIIDEVNKFIS
jgi:DNA-directed RNA polymerase subunit F